MNHSNTPTRQYLNTFLLLILCMMSCENKQEEHKEDSGPNIIIIMADDLGYGDLSCYGSKLINTPNLDRMSEEGMKFTDFHSNGVVCSPTRAALLTGRYQQRSGIEGVVTAANHRSVGLAIEETTFADALKAKDYVTGIFGKWHLGYPEKYNPIYQGFDEFIGFVSGNVDYHSHIDQEAYEDWWKQNKLTKEEGYTTDLITEHALDFIKRHQQEKFILYISHEAPHYPLQGRQSKAFRVVGEPRARGPETETTVIYKEMIEVMDEGIGKIMDLLETLDLDENTLVFFCSDNGGTGYADNGKLRGTKGSVWEGGHRVPAIAWWPGKIKAGQINNDILMTMDIFPTMVNLTNGNNNTEFDGIDFTQTLFKNETIEDRYLFWRHKHSKDQKKVAVRNGTWKLVIQDADVSPELYDLNNDLSEKNNVASEFPGIAKRLLTQLRKWEKEVSENVKSVAP
ncbi:sulfatase-like hydrolase/transferase [Fulvivirgaceae bacterium BMA10]|uniref:Sulfatase-like hydrolase/transferase n=1 Tax=Splendidivirga corallicola TaxID=3051826 RepID=A0ABT8KN41_9BACT|nr:sulfatase-like hydrolase/transferase [Fulvivirgaceae bacterium BMA10]